MRQDLDEIRIRLAVFALVVWGALFWNVPAALLGYGIGTLAVVFIRDLVDCWNRYD